MQSGLNVEIAASALQSIASTIRSGDARLETGGALFGPLDGSRVLHAAGPGAMAEHSARFFRRDLAFTREEAERLYQTDGSQWIGEWHTHVDVPPTPSELDLSTYFRHISNPTLGFNRFLALIISLGPRPTLAAWVLERQDQAIVLIQAGEQAFCLSD